MVGRLTGVFAAVLVLLFVLPAFAQKGEEVIRQERYFYDALKEKKLHLLPELFLDNFHGVFGGGYIDKQAEVKGFESAILLDYKFSEIIVKFPAKNVGIMIYRSYIKGSSKGQTVTGEAYRTSTWVKKNGKWKMILHTDVPVGNTLANKNMKKEAMNFLGISTAAYIVSDIDEAKKWYTKAFGIKPYFDEPYYVGFNINGYELGLQPEEKKRSVKGDGAICYWAVRDVGAIFKRFVDAGAKINEKPNDVGGGVIVASVKDPWENIIGIIRNPNFKEN